MKILRAKLYNCRTYVNSCRFAKDIKDALYKEFPDFLINDTKVYSFEIMFMIKKSSLYDRFKNVITQVIEHIRRCQVCSQQGFICEICSKKELLYPFDIEFVSKCPNCLSCFHTKCFKDPDDCLRCKRKRLRTEVKQSMNSTNDEIVAFD